MPVNASVCVPYKSSPNFKNGLNARRANLLLNDALVSNCVLLGGR